jgi:hypothetical protein
MAFDQARPSRQGGPQSWADGFGSSRHGAVSGMHPGHVGYYRLVSLLKVVIHLPLVVTCLRRTGCTGLASMTWSGTKQGKRYDGWSGLQTSGCRRNITIGPRSKESL